MAGEGEQQPINAEGTIFDAGAARKHQIGQVAKGVAEAVITSETTAIAALREADDQLRQQRMEEALKAGEEDRKFLKNMSGSTQEASKKPWWRFF